MRYFSRIQKKFKPGEVIFSENSEGDGMYIIESGRVRVYTKTSSEKGPVEVEICTLGPNSMFGEMAVLDNGKRSASVMAIEQTSCMIITKRMFELQLERIPPWMVNMIRILVIRLRDTNQRLREIVGTCSRLPADSGSVITIPGEPAPPAETTVDRDSQQQFAIMDRYKEHIIQELFKDTVPPFPDRDTLQ